MNERIKELAVQAMTATTNKFSADREWSADEWRDFYDTKFAELIVGECIDWIDGSPTTEEGSLILSKHFIIANLKQHFGVEE